MKSVRAQLAARLRVLMLTVMFALVAVASFRSHVAVGHVTTRRGLMSEDELLELAKEEYEEELAGECESNPIADPLDLQEKWQAVFYGAGFLYICLGIAMICEEYFVTALNELIEVKGISPDVAGATFMAAGSSSPEVFAALIGLFFSSSEGGGAGVGTVVGSAVFNVLVIIGGAALYSDRGITMEWRTLLRDSGFYAASLVALYVCFADGVLTVVESSLMVALYMVYLVVCGLFTQIVGCVCPEKKTALKGPTAYQDLERAPAFDPTLDFGLGDDLESVTMVRRLMVRMEKDRYVLFKEARNAIVAPFFGAESWMSTDMSHITTQDRATLRKVVAPLPSPPLFPSLSRARHGGVFPHPPTRPPTRSRASSSQRPSTSSTARRPA